MDLLSTIHTNATEIRLKDPAMVGLEERQMLRALLRLAPPDIAQTSKYISFFYLPQVISVLHGKTVDDMTLPELQGALNRAFLLASEALDGTQGEWLPTKPLPKLRGYLTSQTYRVTLSPDMPGVYLPLEEYLIQEMRTHLQHPTAPLVEFPSREPRILALAQILVGFPRLPRIALQPTLDFHRSFYRDYYNGPRKAKEGTVTYYAPVLKYRPPSPPAQ
ncbi:hypothetical protein Y032_0829g2568 [Ancylostoma ceylanicum]|uniref:Uncharacterized protein n=1 Tax=Ancylostoma ceylanicum TaxID=53326 RepID=A0A016WBT8_9BILA|nr:hypothetical protein Y032_0829g2568 [Ancylostoma ceylanicum]